jgi:hypothetical protein
MRFTVALALASLSLAACGGDDGGTVTPIDARRIDGTVSIDAPPAACEISAPSFMLGSTMANFTRRPQNSMMPDPNVYFLSIGGFIEADTGAGRDAVFIQFWPGTMSFPGADVTPGEFDLSMEGNTGLDTCGVCIQIIQNFVNGQGGNGDYMPVSGTLTLSAINPTVGGTYSLTMSNVVMQHVNIDPMTGVTTPAADAATCRTTLNGSLSGMIVAPMAKAGRTGGWVGTVEKFTPTITTDSL